MTALFRENHVRIYVFLFHVISGIFFLYSSTFLNKVDIFLSSFVYLSIYLFITYLICRYSKDLLALIISMFFSVGFLLKTGYSYKNHDSLNVSGWHGYGNFSFTTYELIEMYLVVIAGILGVLFAVIVSNRSRYAEPPDQKLKRLRKGKRMSFNFLIFFWFVSFLSLINHEFT